MFLILHISSNKTLTKYQLEYTYLSEVIHGLGKAFSELILLIPVVYAFNLNNLRIVAAILSFSILLQMLVYNKYCKKDFN